MRKRPLVEDNGSGETESANDFEEDHEAAHYEP